MDAIVVVVVDSVVVVVGALVVVVVAIDVVVVALTVTLVWPRIELASRSSNSYIPLKLLVPDALHGTLTVYWYDVFTAPNKTIHLICPACDVSPVPGFFIVQDAGCSSLITYNVSV